MLTIEHNTEYFPPNVEMKHYNFMVSGQNFLVQSVKNNLITNESIQKIATGQGYDYSTNCLLDYNYFKDYYKMIAIDLRKQQALDADPKAIQ